MAVVAENGSGSDDQSVHPQPQPISSSSCSSNGSSEATAAAPETEYQRDVCKLVDLLSKLNPSAKEFFPSSYHPAVGPAAVPATPRKTAGCGGQLSADAPVFVASTDFYNNIFSNHGSSNDSSSDSSASHQLNRRVRTEYTDLFLFKKYKKSWFC